MKKNKRNKIKKLTLKEFIIFLVLLTCMYMVQLIGNYINDKNKIIYENLNDVGEYSGNIFVQINNNMPYFTDEEKTTKAFEKYSKLDVNGRCGIAYANICKETIPNGEERGSISNVKPTGWVQKKYDEGYLYNRCHLIGYQLSAENANKENLITGTRYFNVEGMLPFENKVAEYINNNKKNHVLYRVTPDFKENNLVAKGVEIEAFSVEDNGKGVCFNVYIFNIQPGIIIDYKTGESNKDIRQKFTK